MSWNIFFGCRNGWMKKMSFVKIKKPEMTENCHTVCMKKQRPSKALHDSSPLTAKLYAYLNLPNNNSLKKWTQQRTYSLKAVFFISSGNYISEAHLRTAIAPQLYMYFQECNGRQLNNLDNSVTVHCHAISHPFLLITSVELYQPISKSTTDILVT